MNISNLITEKQAAQILGLSIQTLRNDRATRRRIPYVKLGKSVRYRQEDIAAVIEAGRIAGGAGK
ncbi:MAG: helix-turn-helix domain-containing protein [Syntrophobacteraceae bacterium]